MAPPAGERSLRELLAAGSAFLARRGVAEARVVCELLAARRLGCRRLDMLTRMAAPLGREATDGLRADLLRVAAGEPVQYVLGEWDFRGLTLASDKRALIPRPETEQLVDLVLAGGVLRQAPAPLIVDVGTGSGCIAISLAHELPRARLVATDISAGALALARENSQRCGLEGHIEFRLQRGCGEFAAGCVDVVVSNPPYIASGMLCTLERHIRDHEPPAALDGGRDGLAVVREITRDAALVLKPGGQYFLEIGDDQGTAAREVLESHGFADVDVRRDLAGKVRFVAARLRGL